MTAISGASPPALPVAPARGAKSANPAASADVPNGNSDPGAVFSSFFNNEQDLTEPGDAHAKSFLKNSLKLSVQANAPDAPGAATPSRKQSDDDTGALVVALIPAQLKLLQPIGLSAQQAAFEQQPVDSKVETIDLPKPENAGPQVPAELAFAAKLVDNGAAQSSTTQAVSKPAVVTAVPPPIPRPAPSATENRAATPQRRMEPQAPQAGQQAPLAGHSQSDIAPSQSQAIAQTPVVRDVDTSSSPMSRTIASAPPVHAAEPVAPVRSPLEQTQAPQTRLQDISIRVGGDGQTSASIRLVDKAGEIHVAVRSSNPQLADSLRGNVEQLTSRLNNTGMTAEVWKPAVTPALRTQTASQDLPQERQGSMAQQWREQNQQNGKQKRPEWAQEFELWQ